MLRHQFFIIAASLCAALLTAAPALAAPPDYPADFDRSPTIQKQRKAALDMAEDKGVIDRITPRDDYIVTWTGPYWTLAPYKLKKQIAETVVAYYWAKNPKLDHTLIRDNYDGSTVGNYNAFFGFRLVGN